MNKQQNIKLISILKIVTMYFIEKEGKAVFDLFKKNLFKTTYEEFKDEENRINLTTNQVENQLRQSNPYIFNNPYQQQQSTPQPIQTQSVGELISHKYDELYEKYNNKLFNKGIISLIILSEILLIIHEKSAGINHAKLISIHSEKISEDKPRESENIWIKSISELFIACFYYLEYQFPSIIHESALILLKNINFIFISHEKAHLLSENYLSLSLSESEREKSKWEHKRRIESYKGMLRIMGEYNYSINSKNKIKKQLIESTVTIIEHQIADIQARISKKCLKIIIKKQENQLLCKLLIIYREMNKKEMNEAIINDLIGILLLHIQNRELNKLTGIQQDVTDELIETFVNIIHSLPPSKLILFPKLFWCGAALLLSDISYDYTGGVRMIIQFLAKFFPSNLSIVIQPSSRSSIPEHLKQKSTAPKIVSPRGLAPLNRLSPRGPAPKLSFTPSPGAIPPSFTPTPTPSDAEPAVSPDAKENDELVKKLIENLKEYFPKNWKPNYPGLGILLLKGICSDLQEIKSIELLIHLILFPCDEIIDVDEERKMLVFIISLLPHLLTYLGGVDSMIISERLSILLKDKFNDLSLLFSNYANYKSSMEGIRRFLIEISHQICVNYFPKYESFTFNLLIQMLEKGPRRHQKTILQILESLLYCMNNPDMNNSLPPASSLTQSSSHLPKDSILLSNEISIFSPIFNYLQGDTWPLALKVLNIILSKFPSSELQDCLFDNHTNHIDKIRLRLLSCQNVPDNWNQFDKGKANVFTALSKIIDQQLPHSRAASRHNSSGSARTSTDSPVAERKKRESKKKTKKRRKSKGRLSSKGITPLVFDKEFKDMQDQEQPVSPQDPANRLPSPTEPQEEPAASNDYLLDYLDSPVPSLKSTPVPSMDDGDENHS